MNDEDIDEAVKWWSRFLKESFTWDNGSAKDSAFANEMIALYKEKIDKTRITLFEISLFEIIKAELKNREFLFIEFDYDPCDILLEALRQSLIHPDRRIFPCKTRMIIHRDRNSISVSQGYGDKDKYIVGQKRPGDLA